MRVSAFCVGVSVLKACGSARLERMGTDSYEEACFSIVCRHFSDAFTRG